LKRGSFLKSWTPKNEAQVSNRCKQARKDTGIKLKENGEGQKIQEGKEGSQGIPNFR
jgi:hypothetical protein